MQIQRDISDVYVKIIEFPSDRVISTMEARVGSWIVLLIALSYSLTEKQIHQSFMLQFGLACSLRKASNVLSESYCQNGPAILAQAWVLVPWKKFEVYFRFRNLTFRYGP